MSGLPSDLVISDEARGLQREAGDPAASVWVTANAGSGKTHVLSERVVRLLLSGVDPSRILCLTYTRTAAANMRAAVFKKLSALATAKAEDFDRLMAELEPGRRHGPAAERQIAARQLFARALETPGGLRIQTIHAFCESILRRFPLEANIGGHFDLLQGEAQAQLLDEARRGLLSAPGSEATAAALAYALDEGGEFGLEKLIQAVSEDPAALKSVLAAARGDGDFAPLFAAFGFAGETEEALAQAVWPAPGFDAADARRLDALANQLQAKRLMAACEKLMAGVTATNLIARADAVAAAFLKGKKLIPYEPDWMVPQGLERKAPGTRDIYCFAANHIAEHHARLRNFRLIRRTVMAYRLAEALIGRIDAMKQRRGLLDFNDLIAATVRLLNRDDVGAWVRYKLDAGIDHVLLDEAQDTSPAQWAVLEPLTREIFDGAAASNRSRGLFVVGDPKQSIYSFQGARPEAFDSERRQHERLAHNVGLEFKSIAFKASFRTAPAILGGVDHVFAQDVPRRGLTSDNVATAHDSLRRAAPGRIDVWEPIRGEPRVDNSDWTTVVQTDPLPSVQQARRIGKVIKDWLDTGFARAGDILVLVRKRSTVVPALTRELKSLSVPVAGADRLKLIDHVAVKDLLAVARITLQPADDLALAALLRSPVFDLSEDGLRAVASARAESETLLEALAHADDARLNAAAQTVMMWRNLADTVPVAAFFGRILGTGGIRMRLLARLGRDAEEIIDEFLRAAENHEREGPRGLEAFAAAMAASASDVKREMEQGRDEVRIMTVHGAKGLEARHVFLIDASDDADDGRKHPALMPVSAPLPPLAGEDVPLWTDGAQDCPLRDAAKARRGQLAEDEYRRLLYVGMTRARDTLTICVHGGPNAKMDGKWAAWIRDALQMRPETRQFTHADGFGVVRFETIAWPDAPPATGPQQTAEVAHPFRFAPLPPEPELPKPLAPSAAALAIEAEDRDALGRARSEPVSPLALARAAKADQPDALLRGTLLHALLQRLPDLAPETREAAALRMLARLAATHGLEATDIAGQPAKWAAGLAREAAGVLALPEMARLLAGASRAEAGLMGRIVFNGAPRMVTGVVDRIVETDACVTLIDYKTGRAPSGGPDPAHVAQLALYGLLAQPIWQGKRIEAALVYSGGPMVVRLEEAMLRAACARLGASPG